MNRRHLSLTAALAFASLAGCFATNPDPWGTPPVFNPPPDEPPVTGALTVDDVAVTSDGNLLTLGYDYNSWSGAQVVQLLDTNLNVITSIELPGVYAMSIGALSGDRAIVSDGYSTVTVIDLNTGAFTNATGYEAIALGPAGFLASTVSDGSGSGEVFNVPCEDPGDWNMDVFDADDVDGDGVLLARVDLDDTGLSGTTDVTAGGGLIFVLGYEAPVAIDASSGAVVETFEQELLSDTTAWAYDAMRNGLWIATYSGTISFRPL